MDKDYSSITSRVNEILESCEDVRDLDRVIKELQEENKKVKKLKA